MKPPCPTCQQTHNPENACREAQPVAEQLRASLASKFTPGPWIVSNWSDKNGIEAENQAALVAVVGRFWQGHEEEVQANRHLIAAAPDGYALAVEVVNHLYTKQDMDRVRIMAREFLAKADGK